MACWYILIKYFILAGSQCCHSRWHQCSKSCSIWRGEISSGQTRCLNHDTECDKERQSPGCHNQNTDNADTTHQYTERYTDPRRWHPPSTSCTSDSAEGCIGLPPQVQGFPAGKSSTGMLAHSWFKIPYKYFLSSNWWKMVLIWYPMQEKAI